MVPVVVRVENRFESDLFFFRPAQNRLSFRGIHHGRLSGCFTHDEVAIVVPQKRYLDYFHSRPYSR